MEADAVKPQPDEIIAVYPGSFDPVTYGHLDIVRRAAGLFREVIVGIGNNPSKEQLFAPEERRALIAEHLTDVPSVRVEAYQGLTIDFARRYGARVIVRGIRDVNDLSHEIQQANVNQMIGQIETVFLLTSDQNVLTSSTYLKQIFELSHGDEEMVHRLVPPNVAAALRAKFPPDASA